MRRILLTLAVLLAAQVTSAADIEESSAPSAALAAFDPHSKIHLVNVFATWCQPCNLEMMDLKALDAEFADSDVQFVAFSIDDLDARDRKATLSRVDNFVSKRDLAWPVVYYTGTYDDLKTFFSFEGSIPLTVLYDSDGNELARHEGMINRQQMESVIRNLLSHR